MRTETCLLFVHRDQLLCDLRFGFGVVRKMRNLCELTINPAVTDGVEVRQVEPTVATDSLGDVGRPGPTHEERIRF